MRFPLSRRALLTRTSQASLGALIPNEFAGPKQGPDVLVVVMDDMRASDWQAFGQTRTLLANGTMFENFILNTPVCGPSRATMFTGRHAHNHRAFTNTGESGTWEQYQAHEAGQDAIYTKAKDAGYRTVISGKFLNGAPKRGGIGPGWSSFAITEDKRYLDFTLNENGKSHEYDGRRKYSTDVLANHLINEIEDANRHQPLMLFYTPKAPKGPSTPDPARAAMFTQAAQIADPATNEADISDKPQAVRRRKPLTPQAMDDLARANRQRLETLASVDAAIVRILTAINQRRDLSHLYVFITSDNGFALGDHRLTGKGRPYDSVIRVPLLAFGPGFAPGVNSRLCSMVDLAPTIAQVTGVPLPNTDGLSLLSAEQRDTVLLECRSGSQHYDGLRTATELYVEYDDGEREYYDHTTDPDELTNRLADWDGHMPSLDPVHEAQMISRLATARICSGRSCWDPLTAPPVPANGRRGGRRRARGR